MTRKSSRVSAVLVVALCTACGLQLGSRAGVPAGGSRRPAVALATDGSAFDRHGLRQRVADSVARALGRPVVLVGTAASTVDADLKDVATRMTRADTALARYDWREPHCASQAVVLTALRLNVDAVYRVSLNYTRRLRPATDAELASADRRPGAVVATLGMLGLAAPRQVREEELAGTITVATLTSGRRARPTVVSRRVMHVEPTAFTPDIEIEAVVAEAIAHLPQPPAPQWEALARRLVSAGCPFLALMISENRLKPAPAGRRVHNAALAAIRRSIGRRSAKELSRDVSARFSGAIQDGDLERAGSILGQYEADPARTASTVQELRRTLAAAREHAAQADARPDGAGQEPEAKLSCTVLCRMHMVELCNNQKTLWSAHSVKWEQTPCGTRRDEAFLQDCYRRQWLSGTFDDACVRPCEATSEGREGLIRMLQTAGCRFTPF